MLQVFLTGFLLGGSLIIAIGAQNAFILRQGLLQSHVFILCLVCALSDAVLIALGVAGFGTFVSSQPVLLTAIRIFGALFLFGYALLAFKRAMKPQAMEVTDGKAGSLGRALSTCLAFTFLNPHVYLDTVILVGGISSQYTLDARPIFAAGAMFASFVWFFALGYGARLLIPVFQKPTAWRILDFAIGIVMAAIGLSLIWPFFT